MGNTCVWVWLTLVKHHVATHCSACGVVQVWGPCCPCCCCRFYQNDRAREETRKAGEPVLGELKVQNKLATPSRSKAFPPVMLLPCYVKACHCYAPGIGRNTQIKGAVIESNVSIGADVCIFNAAQVVEADRADTGGYIIQVGQP